MPEPAAAPIKPATTQLRASDLARLLDHASTGPDGSRRRVTVPLDFQGVSFEGDVSFESTDLESGASFSGATFFGSATFSDTHFQGDADFSGVTFRGRSDFSQTRFSALANFSDSVFHGDVRFDDAKFSGQAVFIRALFLGDQASTASRFVGVLTTIGALGPMTGVGIANFSDVDFEQGAFFGGSAFSRGVSFRGTRFGGNVGLEVVVTGGAFLRGARFERARSIGPIWSDELVFDEAEFDQPVRLAVGGRRLFFGRAVFLQRTELLVHSGDLWLEGTDFGSAVTVAAIPSLAAELPVVIVSGEGGLPPCWEEVRGNERAREGEARLISLRRANLAETEVSGVSLTACLFAGACGIERLRVTRGGFSQTPAGWRLRLRYPHWTRRDTIAEEHLWRLKHGYAGGWNSRIPGWTADDSAIGNWRFRDWVNSARDAPATSEVQRYTVLSAVAESRVGTRRVEAISIRRDGDAAARARYPFGAWTSHRFTGSWRDTHCAAREPWLPWP